MATTDEDLIALLVGKPEKPADNTIPKPEGFAFSDERSAKYGQLFTVRMKQDDDEDRLCITEIEGLPYGDHDEEEEEIEEAYEE